MMFILPNKQIKPPPPAPPTISIADVYTFAETKSQPMGVRPGGEGGQLPLSPNRAKMNL